MNREKYVHVAVGVLINAREEVLVALRPREVHQGGLWEFPGGKVEPQETVQQALGREFEEELGLRIEDCTPLMRVRHDYADKSVLLDVWTIGNYAGTPRGREGQQIAWRRIQELQPADFPEANAGIIRILALPRRLAITPEAGSREEMESSLSQLLERGIGLIYFRQKSVSAASYHEWFVSAEQACKERGVMLLYCPPVDRPSLDPALQFRALHVSSAQLGTLETRPVGSDRLFSASCHTLEELRRAESLGADFVLLSPVRPTAKYPDSQLLGWSGFEHLARQVSLPVFALGGMKPEDLKVSRQHGGFGIAGISAFAQT